jgi:hypothetical protein
MSPYVTQLLHRRCSPEEMRQLWERAGATYAPPVVISYDALKRKAKKERLGIPDYDPHAPHVQQSARCCGRVYRRWRVEGREFSGGHVACCQCGKKLNWYSCARSAYWKMRNAKKHQNERKQDAAKQ